MCKYVEVIGLLVHHCERNLHYTVRTFYSLMKQTSFHLLCIAKESEEEDWKVDIQPFSAEPAFWILYICRWDSFGIMSGGDPLHHFSHHRNIYSVNQWAGLNPSLIVLPSIVKQLYLLNFDTSMGCDSMKRKLWHLRFNLKPVYCNRQILESHSSETLRAEMVDFGK